ncbi:MAG: hypothetical protein ABSG84_16555, partial [Acidobacteriaceae bacterium]
INRRQNLPRLLLALSLKDDENKDTAPIDVPKLTGHSISVLSCQLKGNGADRSRLVAGRVSLNLTTYN